MKLLEGFKVPATDLTDRPLGPPPKEKTNTKQFHAAEYRFHLV